MTTLADREIELMSSSGNLISENFASESVTPNGYDLRIGNIRPIGLKDDMDELFLENSSGAWVSTLEYIRLPPDVMGQLWIRSSFARSGVVGSFGAVEAGYHGNLTLTFFNLGPGPVTLKKGERIAQIVFHRLSSIPDKLYSERSGTYAGLRGINTGPLVE